MIGLLLPILVGVIGAICVVGFCVMAGEGTARQRATRYGAALTSLVSLLALTLVYSASLHERLLVAAGDGASSDSFLIDLDSVVTSLSDWMSRHASIVGHRYRPDLDAALLALAIFLLSMMLQVGIFVFAHERGRRSANDVGSATLSHFTAYALLLVLLVEGFSFDGPAVGIVGALALGLLPLLAQFSVIAKKIVEDLGHLFAALVEASRNCVIAGWERVTNGVIAAAQSYRQLMRAPTAWYERRVRGRLTAMSDGLIGVSEGIRQEAKDKGRDIEDRMHRDGSGPGSSPVVGGVGAVVSLVGAVALVVGGLEIRDKLTEPQPETAEASAAQAQPLSPGELTVLVANGSQLDGAGARLTAAVGDLGYQTVEAVNAPEQVGETRILFAKRRSREAAALAVAIGAPASAVAEMPESPGVDPGEAQLVVVLGTDLAR